VAEPGQTNSDASQSELAALPPLLTPQDLAAFLRIPVKTLYQWRYQGIGPTAIRVGRHLRCRQDRWQFQGPQFRLAIKADGFERSEREAYVKAHYSRWFDFAPLRAITGISDLEPPRFRGKSNLYQFWGYA
jgi:hypothetical protein